MVVKIVARSGRFRNKEMVELLIHWMKAASARKLFESMLGNESRAPISPLVYIPEDYTSRNSRLTCEHVLRY